MGLGTRTKLALEYVLFVSSKKHGYSEDKSSKVLQSESSISNFVTKKKRDRVSDSGQFLPGVPVTSPFIPEPSHCYGNQHGQAVCILCLPLFTGLSTEPTHNGKSMNMVE